MVNARYPLEMEVTSTNTIKSLEITRKIKEFSPLVELKAKLLQESTDENINT